MYLAEVETRTAEAAVSPVSCSAKWDSWPASTLSHHGRACCDIAREWVLATDYSQLGASGVLTGPRWVRQKYPWGPSPWPLHWCEAVERERLDCGAHGAIAHELFRARGVESFPLQLVQQYSEDATRHWGHKWGEEEVPSAWIDGDLIYHEGCAVVVGDDEVKLWDASAGWWINPRQTAGYGSLLALRICDAAASGRSVSWAGRRLPTNVWTDL
jgi:hypothetical protein